jgi:GntR family transcriptional regulator
MKRKYASRSPVTNGIGLLDHKIRTRPDVKEESLTEGVDRASERPAYRQIADRLRERILSGDLGPGSLLPSETELMEEFDVSRATARQAVALLKAEGRIDTRHGRGSFVRTPPPLLRMTADRFSRANRRPGRTPFTVDVGTGEAPRLEVRSFTRMTAPPEIAARLELAEGDQVLARWFRFWAGSRPVQLSNSYLPYGLVQGTPVEDPSREPWPGGSIAQLESVGVQVDEINEDVGTRLPDPEEAHDLDLRAGVPVLTIARTMFAAGTPVLTSDIVMAGDQYVLSYRFPVD